MKILMIGLGGIGQRHLRNVRTLLGEQVELAAYRTRRQDLILTDKLQVESTSGLEQRYSLTVFHDLDVALAWKPTAVFICNPSSLHLPTALAAAKAGCHLFVEKPLSHDLAQTEELATLVEQNGLTALVAYQLRFHPCLQSVHTLLQKNAVGRLVAVRAEVGEFLPGWHPYEDYRQMYASRKELGGGVILSQIHELDYLYWFLGLPQKLYALGGHLSSLEIDVEDTASILMDCSGVPVHLHQDYIQRPPSRGLQIVGDEGKIVADLRALTVRHFDSEGNLASDESWPAFERNQLFLDELAHFFACIEGKEPPLVSIRDGAQSLRMALAAKHSLATGEVVRLP
jgi:predicted dehydrogenase